MFDYLIKLYNELVVLLDETEHLEALGPLVKHKVNAIVVYYFQLAPEFIKVKQEALRAARQRKNAIGRGEGTRPQLPCQLGQKVELLRQFLKLIFSNVE
jgi:hypothetical protein